MHFSEASQKKQNQGLSSTHHRSLICCECLSLGPFCTRPAGEAESIPRHCSRSRRASSCAKSARAWPGLTWTTGGPSKWVTSLQFHAAIAGNRGSPPKKQTQRYQSTRPTLKSTKASVTYSFWHIFTPSLSTNQS